MNLDTLIRDQNQQWTNTSYFPPEWLLSKRNLYSDLKKSLENDLVVTLTGLRRVGKSTLIKQATSYLLETKVTPENIFYFSFDASIVKNESETLRSILETYASSMFFLPLSQVKKKTYIFLDEVQTIPYWQDIIKTYYDLNPNLKFIISGSSSLFISRKSTESLAGRLQEIVIPPLSFEEYLKFNLETSKEIDKTGDLEKYSHFFLTQLNYNFEKYLEIGQFPQPVNKNYSETDTRNYLQKIEDKIIEVDLPRTFPVKRPDILKIIFTYLRESSGSLLSYDNLTNDLGVDIRTTIKYIDWLKKAFLIDICLNQTKKLVKAARTSKKVYISSTNFTPKISIGSKVETYIYNLLKSMNLKVEFYRFQNQEIDFVLTNKKGQKIPLEVKYQESIKSSDEKNLIAFSKRHQSPYAFLITKNIEDEKKKGPRKIGFTRFFRIPASKIELSKNALLQKL